MPTTLSDHVLVPVVDADDARSTARHLAAYDVDSTVAIARGPERSPMSLREALTRRLEG